MSDIEADLSERDEHLERVLADYLHSVETGQPLDQQRLVAEHPDLADDLQSFFRNRDAIERLAEPLKQQQSADAKTLLMGRDTRETSPRVRYVGEYELLEEIGRGGMGVVYRARQAKLNRQVALKMILAGQLASADDIQRFHAEAEAAANLDHPHIAPLYEIGEHEGHQYFSMKLIEGRSLRDALPELSGDLSRGAELLSKVARAVHHAHQRGVLHRDLKPGNILLDARGEPYVTDFGLAKRVEGESQLTQTGAVVGTPSYMAPEQARAEKLLSTAVDVYSLGAMLYELLAGRPPFRADSPVETLMQVLSRDPSHPRSFNPHADLDLETIAMKCLEKDPAHRYDSAAALADELDRWRRGEPITARPVTAWQRGLKWARRQPLLSGTLGMSLLLAVALLIASGFSWHNAELRAEAVQDLGKARQQFAQVDSQRQQAEKEREKAEKEKERIEQERSRAEKLAEEQRLIAEDQKKLATRQSELADRIRKEIGQLEQQANIERTKAEAARNTAAQAQKDLFTARQEARLTLYAADMQLANAALQNDNVSTIGDLLNRYREPQQGEDPRGFEWHFLQRQLSGARLTWRVDTPNNPSLFPCYSVAISPDGRTVATASPSNGQGGAKLRLWNFADGKLLRTIDAGHATMIHLAFTGDGMKIVATVRKPFDYRKYDQLIQPAAKKKEPFQLSLLTNELEFRAWNVGDEKAAEVRPVEISLLKVTAISALVGIIPVQHAGQAMVVSAVTRSPDGKRLYLGGMGVRLPGEAVPAGQDRNIKGGLILVYDIESKDVVAQREFKNMITAIAVSPEGKQVAVGTANGELELHASNLDQTPLSLVGKQGYVFSLQYTADGKQLLSGTRDGQIRLWDTATGSLTKRYQGHSTAVVSMALHPDGQSLVSGTIDGEIKVWDTHRIIEPLVLRGHNQYVTALAFSADGSRLISGDYSGGTRTWQAHDGKLLKESKIPGMEIYEVTLSPFGKWLAWTNPRATNEIIIRDLAAGTDRRIKLPLMEFSSVVISGDDKWMAVSQNPSGTVSIWNIAEGTQQATLPGKSQVYARVMSFSADGQFVVLLQGRDPILWDWRKNQVHRFEADGVITPERAALSFDNTRLAVSVGPGVKIWSVAEKKIVQELRGAGSPVSGMAFTPDGRRLLTAAATPGQQGLLKLWDPDTGREVFSASLPPIMISAIAISPDGHRIAAALAHFNPISTETPGEVHVWDATPATPATPVNPATAVTPATPVAVETTQPDDAAALQGTWVVTAAEFNGTAVKASEGDKFTFAANKVTIETKVKKTEPVPFTLDSARQPKTIDVQDKAPSLGIYRLQGDNLTLCYGTRRPTEFDSKQGLLLTLKRQSP